MQFFDIADKLREMAIYYENGGEYRDGDYADANMVVRAAQRAMDAAGAAYRKSPHYDGPIFPPDGGSNAEKPMFGFAGVTAGSAPECPRGHLAHPGVSCEEMHPDSD